MIGYNSNCKAVLHAGGNDYISMVNNEDTNIVEMTLEDFLIRLNNNWYDWTTTEA